MPEFRDLDFADLPDAQCAPIPRPHVNADPESVVDHGLPFRVVPCGKCVECAKARRSSWYVRVRRQIECAAYKYCFWVTLTWKDSKLPNDKEQLSACVRRFKDRCRKMFGETPDHFLVTERGDDDRFSHRLHIHGFLMFRTVVPSYDDIHRVWSVEGFSWIKTLGYGPNGERYGLKGITYAMKYIFKSFMYRLKGDKLSGCIYASLGLGKAALSSQSYRHKLRLMSDPCYRPSESFDGRYSYPLPRYMADKLYRFVGAKPSLSPEILLLQLLGPKPPGVYDLDAWVTARKQQISRALFRCHSLSQKINTIDRALHLLLLKFPYLWHKKLIRAL